MISMLQHQFVKPISRFRARVKLQQQSKMAKGNFFDLYFGNFDGEFEDIILI